MERIKFEKFFELFVFVFVILLTNRGTWLCLTDFNNPLSFCGYHNIGIELSLYLIISILAIWLIAQRGLLITFFNKWKKNKLVLAFIGLAILSITWSIFPTGTLYHIFILLFTTLLASSIGSSYSSERFLTVLLWYAGLMVIASFGLLLLFPNAAIMADPHMGSWRGIYWHKNFTGSLMAFANTIFLLYGFTASRHDKGRIIVSAVAYLLSLIFTIFSRSAAGIVVWLVLNGLTIILLAWSKIKHRLERVHYFIAVGVALLTSMLAVFNLNILFGLINRESGLTGRVPLWNYLITSWVSEHPIVGHGFAAIWHIEQFRKQTTTSQGWLFEITNGHNGFMDIMLGLGVIGAILVLAVFLLSLYRTGKYFIVESRSEAVLPFLIVMYFLLANLSISFFLEFESFHWMLLIVALFMTTPNEKSKSG